MLNATILQLTLLMALLLSLNARGLCNREKLHKVLNTTKCDILLLQETKWSSSPVSMVRGVWEEDVFFSNTDRAMCGVATLIKNNVFDKVTEIHKCSRGRLLKADSWKNNVYIRFINIYAPNTEGEKKVFFKELKTWVNNNSIITGDFNVPLTQFDISGNNLFKDDVSRQSLFEIIKQCNLVDLWRIMHPNKTQFSRHQLVQNTLKQSRIDYAPVASSIVHNVNSIEYVLNTWSDHSLMKLSLFPS